MNSQEMEDRLIRFAALVIEICESLPNSTAGKILSGQLTKSSNIFGIELWRSKRC